MKLLNQDLVTCEELDRFEDEVVAPIDERLFELEKMTVMAAQAIFKLRRTCIGLLVWAAISVPLIVTALLK